MALAFVSEVMIIRILKNGITKHRILLNDELTPDKIACPTEIPTVPPRVLIKPKVDVLVAISLSGMAA